MHNRNLADMWAPCQSFIYGKIWNKKEKFYAFNMDGHMTEFVKDEVSHAEVDKMVLPLFIVEEEEKSCIKNRDLRQNVFKIVQNYE